MKRGALCAIGMAVVLAAPGTGRTMLAAKPCADIPLRVTIFNTAIDGSGATVQSAIQSDGGGEYTSAAITVCAGTNDAVVNLASTRRTFTYIFPAPIVGSIVQTQPAWVPGTYNLSGWINVRNITFSKAPFTTHMGSTFTGPDRASYRLGWDPFVVDAPDLHSGENLAQLDNSPQATSPAMVYPTYPVTCGPGNMPRWLVRGTTPNDQNVMEVTTLYKQTSGPHTSLTHSGQYTLPFEMSIEAMQCFSY